MAEGMGLPVFAVALVALAETAGSVLILLGGFGMDWATRLAGFCIAPVMLGAIFIVHWGRWPFTSAWSESGPGAHPMGGMEFQVVLLLLALFFLAAGNDFVPRARSEATVEARRRTPQAM